MALNQLRVVLIAMLVLPLSVASAQETKPRMLGKHTFPVAEYSPTPFTLTSFAMRVGVEQSQVPTFPSVFQLSADTRSKVDLSSLLVAEAVDLSVRLHDRVSIAGAAYGRVRVGANRPTLVNTGVDYSYGGNLAVLVKLARARQFQLSLRGSFGASTGQVASIGVLIADLKTIADSSISQQQSGGLTQQEILDKLQAAFRVATSELMTPFSTWTASGSLVMALAFDAYLGLQASLGFTAENASYSATRYEEQSNSLSHFDRSVHSLRPIGTLALDFDAAPARVPIDIMLEYQLAPTWVKTSGLGMDVSQASVEQLIGLALYYSGRADLQLGITGVLVFRQTPLLGENSQPSGHPRDLAGRFVFRYFW
jgi:hypothetical protein